MNIRLSLARVRNVFREEGGRVLLRKIMRRVFVNTYAVREEKESKDNIPFCEVLFINGCDHSVPHPARYRVKHQMEQLSYWGVSTLEVFYTDLLIQHKDCASVFVFFRCPITENIKNVIDLARQAGKTIYFDIDDLVIDTKYTDDLSVVKGMDEDARALFDDGVRRMGETLRMCDAAIVSTERLAIELKRYVPDTFINRNVASREMVKISENALLKKSLGSTDAVTIGYFSGSITHNLDFREVLSALSQVMEAYPHVYLKVVGDLDLPTELQPYSDRVLRAPLVDWRDLPTLVVSVDINLAPLENTLFNEAKSENKWVEAALVKVPTVASAVGAFERMIDSGQTGVLCSSEDEWKSALLHMVEDVSWRNFIGENAHSYCTKHCVTEKTGYALTAFLVDRGHSISELAPVEQDACDSWVDSYLASRGMSRKKAAFDLSPWDAQSLADRISLAQEAVARGYALSLIIYEKSCGDTATFRYFGYNVCQRLERSLKDRAVYFFNEELDCAYELLSIASTVVVVRGRLRPDLHLFLKAAKQAGVRVAYAMDDNALGLSMAPRIVRAMAQDTADSFERDFWFGTAIRFELAAGLADCFFASSPYYAKILGARYGKPVYVLHSSLNDEQICIANTIIARNGIAVKNLSQFVVGYFSGTSSHQEDFALVKSSLVQFLDSHDNTRLLLVGCFELDDILFELYQLGKVIILPRVDYVTLQYLQASVDVVLAPLEQDEFSHCKSALKVFEAGIVGVPACASPAFCYQEAIVDGETGFLCQTENDWITSLEKLYACSTLRQEMGEHAHVLSLDRYYGGKPLREIEDALAGLSGAKSVPIPQDISLLLEDVSGKVLCWDDAFEVNPLFARLFPEDIPKGN